MAEFESNLNQLNENNQSESPSANNADDIEALTVEQIKTIEAAQAMQSRKKISPTQPVSPAVITALYSGDNQEHPLFTRDKTGAIKGHVGNLAYQTGTAKSYVTPSGELEVMGRREALEKTAEADIKKINDYAAAAYPEFLKDYAGQSGALARGTAAIGSLVMSAPRGFLSVPANAVGSALSISRYSAEADWEQYKGQLSQNTKDRVAVFIKMQMEEAEKVKQQHLENGEEEFGDGMYASAQERIFSPDVQAEYGLSAEEMGALKHYKEVVEARDADMRRSLFIKDFSENFGKEGEEALYNLLDLTEDDRNSAVVRLSEAGGELAGNLAFFYMTGRMAGAAGETISSAKNALKGKGFLNYARAMRANGAVKLAADAGVPAGFAAKMTFQELSIIPPVFASQYNQIRTEALLSGKDLNEANSIALAAAAAETGLEFAGFKIFKRFYTKGGWMRNVLLRNIIPEGLQEASQTAAENTITQHFGVTDKQWSDIMSEIGFSLLAGMVGGAAFATGRMRFEGFMAQVEAAADRYTHTMSLLGSEKARQAYSIAMEELAFEEWLENHPEVDQREIDEKRAKREANRKESEKIEEDVRQAKEDIKEMYRELKEYYETRVKKLNPDVKKSQLKVGWDMIKTQVGIALDGNTLTSKYYAAADHVINMYYNKMPQISKYQKKQIADMLKASGKYTRKQIKALTSSDHIEATNAKLDLLAQLQTEHLIKQGVEATEAAASAQFTRKLIASSALINPDFDARAMAKKLHTNVLHIKNATFYKLDELRGTPFEPLSYKMLNAKETLDVKSLAQEKETMTGLSKLLFTNGDITEQDSAKYNKMLYGKEDVDPGLKRTRELLTTQAGMVKSVVENMPTDLNREVTPEEAGAMWLMNNRGFSWADILKKAGINMKGNRGADKFFALTAKDIVPMPKAGDLKRMKRLLNRIQGEYLNFPRQEGQRLKESKGVFSPQDNLIILNNGAEPGTFFHEHNHFSMYALLNNMIDLDEVGLLPDRSLLQPLKDKLASKMQGAKWLTEREFQETVNDALMQYLDSGKCKDPIFTAFFALLKSKGYQARVDLYASRLSKTSESKLNKTQQKELQGAIAEVFGTASVSDIITKANQVRNHVALKDLPQRPENKGIRTYHAELANMLADELQALLNSVPVKNADEFSRQIELARNEDYGAPITEEVYTPGQEKTETRTITNKGNITKLLVLGEQISAKALDFAYDVITTEKSMSQALSEDGEPLYDVAADVISPNRQPDVMSISEVMENLKQITPSWEGVKEVFNSLANSLKDLMFSLEGSSGEVANELRDLIMREVWNESSYRNLFRSQLRPLAEAKKEWLSKFSGVEKTNKLREFNRQVTANLGDGNFGAAREWISKNFGEKIAKQFDTVMQILHGDKNKAEAWMKMSVEERKNNPIGYLYKGAMGILLESGVSIDNVMPNFFPMLVRDFKGLTKQRFGHSYTYSEIDKIKARMREEYMAKTKNVDEKGKPYLSQEEEAALELEVAELVNSRMQRNVTDEDKISSFFKRRFRDYGKTLDNEEKAGQATSILDYYFDPFEALDRYMDAVFRTATARHLIGHTVQMKNGEPAFNHLGSIKEEVKKIQENKTLGKEEKERRVNELLHMNGKVGLYLATHDFSSDPHALNRFLKAMHAYVSRTSADPDDFFNWMRAVNQATMLGSIFSALNQINDLQYCFTLFGVKPTGKALMDVIFNHDGSDVIKLEDVGGESSTEAFRPSDETPMSKLTKWIFQHTGFEWADVRLKEVTINAFNNYAKEMAENILNGNTSGNLNPADVLRFNEILNEVYPDRTEHIALSERQQEAFEQEQNAKKKQLLEDLAAGKQTQDTKYIQWYMLCKMQPMNSATVSAHYNSTNSFGRLCWQFNTVSSRQFGFLRESFLKEKKIGGPMQAAKFLAKFVLAAWLVGIPKEILEALLKGKKPEAIDLAAVPLQAMWLNQYTLSTLKRQGLAAAASTQFTPKAGIVNNLSKDIAGIITLNPKGYATRNVPIVGPFIWYWVAGGRTAAVKNDTALFHHKMTKEEYEAKVAQAKENAKYMKDGE